MENLAIFLRLLGFFGVLPHALGLELDTKSKIALAIVFSFCVVSPSWWPNHLTTSSIPALQALWEFLAGLTLGGSIWLLRIALGVSASWIEDVLYRANSGALQSWLVSLFQLWGSYCFLQADGIHHLVWALNRSMEVIPSQPQQLIEMGWRFPSYFLQLAIFLAAPFFLTFLGVLWVVHLTKAMLEFPPLPQRLCQGGALLGILLFWPRWLEAFLPIYLESWTG
ncbi:MAG: hypothetical protein D6805_08330 [Planctomycetota bacterium]|nr:MAG: hypothetical protein D6805_08330 [Planctomycetota bacterium]